MSSLTAQPEPDQAKADALLARNSNFYNALWAKTYLTKPERFNTWALISPLLPAAPDRLEIGPGLRPRLPIDHTHFVDITPETVARLAARGGLAQLGEITALPHAAGAFDLVAAFDVIEHVEDDERAFTELARVLKVGGRLIFSVPLHPTRWTKFDAYVGHARRYEPAALVAILARHGLVVEQSVVFGMQSNNPRLLDFTVLGFEKCHGVAMRMYNWLFFPLGMMLQKRLAMTEGLMDLSNVDEVLIVCRRQ